MNNNANTVVINEWANRNYIHNEKMDNSDWLPITSSTFLEQNTTSSWIEEPRIDAVSVIAFYRRMLHHDCIILVKQYRPALNNYTIEMPTGTVKHNETPGESALRELKESTGYSGRVKKIGPILAKDCDASNCAMRLITVEVNGDSIDNRYIKPSLSKEEFKEYLLIPVSELLQKLSAFSSAGFLIDSRLDAFAVGLVMGNHTRKTKTPTSLVA